MLRPLIPGSRKLGQQFRKSAGKDSPVIPWQALWGSRRLTLGGGRKRSEPSAPQNLERSSQASCSPTPPSLGLASAVGTGSAGCYYCKSRVQDPRITVLKLLPKSRFWGEVWGQARERREGERERQHASKKRISAMEPGASGALCRSDPTILSTRSARVHCGGGWELQARQRC